MFKTQLQYLAMTIFCKLVPYGIRRQSVIRDMQDDEELTNAVHCNIAVQLLDEGIEHGRANVITSRVMKHIYEVDFDYLEYLAKLNKDEGTTLK